jgi:LacI family transcriptional regulator
MEWLDFSTSGHQRYRFGFVLPAARRGFFDLIDRVIAQAAGDFRHQHFTEITHRLRSDDGVAFATELAKLGDMDGIALLAPDVPQVKLVINELVRSGVHVVTLFSDVPGSRRETFVGADNRAAGRTAGVLLGRCLPRNEPARCAVLSPATRAARHLAPGGMLVTHGTHVNSMCRRRPAISPSTRACGHVIPPGGPSV